MRFADPGRGKVLSQLRARRRAAGGNADRDTAAFPGGHRPDGPTATPPGAALAGLVATRLARVPLLRAADCSAPAIGVSIAVLRIGCPLAGCAPGTVTAVPWGITDPPDSEAALLQINGGWSLLMRRVAPVHPIPIYEILAALLVAALGYLILPRGARPGLALAAVVGGYSAARLLIHPFRWVPDGGTPSWFDPAMYLVVLTGAVVWAVAGRMPAVREAVALRPHPDGAPAAR